jgi:valyl-tRNA synthetase
VLHGLVLDADGQKMSKSKGNGIDPLEVIDESGADALRFAMAHASTGGQDVRWDPRRVEMGRNFNTKLWNAARFVRSNLGGPEDPGVPERLADRWILSRLQAAVRDVTAALEAFDLGAATRLAYDFTWSTFCYWYLEAAKPALREDDARTRATLRHAFEGVLALLHPIVPFVTSELWSALGHERQLAESDWPTVEPAAVDPAAERDFERLQAAVAAVRQLRADADLPPNQKVPVVLEGAGAAALAAEADVFGSLARAQVLDVAPAGAALAQPVADVVLRLPFEGVVDVAAWTAKQEARLVAQRAEVARSSKKLANERFVAGAPEAVVAEERRRLAEAERLVSEIEASLARLA